MQSKRLTDNQLQLTLSEQEIMKLTGIKYDGRYFNHPKTNSSKNILSVLGELLEHGKAHVLALQKIGRVTREI